MRRQNRDKWMDLQQVPSRQNVHEVQEVQWVQAGHSYHPYQENQQIQKDPVNSKKGKQKHYCLNVSSNCLRHKIQHFFMLYYTFNCSKHSKQNCPAC